MNTSRRKFFGLSAGLAAAPLVGCAKVLGVVAKPVKPERYVDGGILTAAALNAQFDYLIQRIDSVL